MSRMPTTYAYQPADHQELSPGVLSTPLKGVYYLPYQRHVDHRGFYVELARIPELEPVLGAPFTIQQLNHSHSATHVIRGFHAEKWQKLLTIISGTAFCAFADFRTDSPQFGQVLTAVVGENGLAGSFFLPSGMGNGFCVLAGPVNYLYAVDALYRDRDPAGDIAINLFDPDLNVPWPISPEEMVYSQRDTQGISLREKFPEKFQSA